MYKNSSHEREVQFFETFWEETFQFFESHWKTRKVQFFESERKTSTLWVILKKRFIKRGSIRWVKSYFLKKSSIQRVIQKKVQYFESYQRKKVESSESYWRISILWVVFKKKVQCPKKVIFKKVQFCESYWKKIQFCESYSYFKKKSILRVTVKKRINSLSHFFLKKYFKKVQVCESLKVKFSEGEKKSLSHVIKKGSILRVILKKNLSVI